MGFLTLFLYTTFLVTGKSFAKPAGGSYPVFNSIDDSHFAGDSPIEHFLDSIPPQRFHSDERLEHRIPNHDLSQSLNALELPYSLPNPFDPTEINPSDIPSTVSFIQDEYLFPHEGNTLQPGTWPLGHHQFYAEESQPIYSPASHWYPCNFEANIHPADNLSLVEHPDQEISIGMRPWDHLMSSHSYNTETYWSNLAHEGSYDGQHLTPGPVGHSCTMIDPLTGEGLRSPNSSRKQPLLKDSTNPSQYLPNPKKRNSLSNPPDPGTAMEASSRKLNNFLGMCPLLPESYEKLKNPWRSDMGSGPLSSVSQDAHLMPHLEPAANSDTTNHSRALRDLKYSNGISNILEDLARPPADSFADVHHMLLDRPKNWIKKRKGPMVDLPEKNKRRGEDTITKANQEDFFFVDPRPATGDTIEDREHLVNPFPNRASALSIFNPEPSLNVQSKKKEELQNELHPTSAAGSMDEDSLHYFFVISTLRFPDHRVYQNQVDGLEKIFRDNFKPLSWPPKLEGKSQSSTTGRIDAISLDVWNSLLHEICRRNMAFLWVFTSPESSDLRLREQIKFSEWLTEQLGFDLDTTSSPKHDRHPIMYLLSNYLRGMTMTGHIPPPECASNPTTPQFHLKLTTKQEQSAMRTKCALHILINYYKSMNFEKWWDLFRNDKVFVRLFAKLKVTERHTRFTRYVARKKDVEKLQLFPWEDAKKYSSEAIEKIRKRGVALAIPGMNIENFVANHGP